MKQKITAGICSILFISLVGMEQPEKTERTLNYIFSAKNLISLIQQQEKDSKIRVDNINNVLTILQNNCWSEQLESLFFTYYFAPQITLCESDPKKSMFANAFLIHQEVIGYKQGIIESNKFKCKKIQDKEVINDMELALKKAMPKLLCIYYLSAALQPEIVNTHMCLYLVPQVPSYLLQSYVKTWSDVPRDNELNVIVNQHDRIYVNHVPYYAYNLGPRDRNAIYLEIGDQHTVNYIWCRLPGHTNDINKLSFNNDGTLLASSSLDETIKIWDTKSKTCIKSFNDTKTKVLSFSNDNKYLASGDAYYIVKVWRLSDDSVRFLFLHNKKISTLAWSLCNKYIFSGSHDATIKLWDVEQARCLHTFEGHTNAVTDISLNARVRPSCSDKNLLASASQDTTIRLWDIDSRECVAVLNAHFPVEHLRFMRYWGLVAAVYKEHDISNHNEIQLWNIRTQTCAHTLTDLKGCIKGIFYDIPMQELCAFDHYSHFCQWEIGAWLFRQKDLSYYEEICLDALTLPQLTTNQVIKELLY